MSSRRPHIAVDASSSEYTSGNGSSQLLTADELAQRWQVPKAQVYRLSREGRMPVVRIGRYFRYQLVAVEAFEAGGAVTADG
jgi:excisionase family DNA binding protein